ncbi:uncharacterized protein UV8b_07068 [Ustilaginoidea virens]|uniref:20S-pre-rRNA D-site endonuclease NOB1 n=1 Tax=Ustilaginoidea virens TaxID=1159556 RepID=A0A063CBJ0_USTVR|nr:uncharacterized protein UV8b_07068 [Ustilaginoidea virens]QUC22827.1 hypothetical protein UV8b_07068 [Ustilaginoidea virens]GAO15372.1 hypothetical protein UVI_02010360 [Ustilaginoidea virens]
MATPKLEGMATQPRPCPPTKPIHSLVLDTGPLIKNDPSVSALVSHAEQLYILPSVLPEIRDAATRARVETSLLPFAKVRAPGAASVKFVTEFARRTGDLAVLSRTDVEVVALGYELECERNNGDWRLRRAPGQKALNGQLEQGEAPATKEQDGGEVLHHGGPGAPAVGGASADTPGLEDEMDSLSLGVAAEQAGQAIPAAAAEDAPPAAQEEDQDAEWSQVPVSETPAPKPIATPADAAEDSDDGDDDGWITPSNLKRHQAHDAAPSSANTPSLPLQKTLQAAILTSDYAMQNVALRINLNLVTPSFSRITHLKNWVLRCHGCFAITKDADKQFCPKCGQPTLTRVSCSTDRDGNFQIHLKKNFQWNNRGNVYSVPKPVHGSANGRLPRKAGGKNGWGRDLILAEDQKEYVRASDEQRRQRKKDPMDEDYLPAMLGGKRSGGGGRVRVGAGRNVNSKRH